MVKNTLMKSLTGEWNKKYEKAVTYYMCHEPFHEYSTNEHICVVCNECNLKRQAGGSSSLSSSTMPRVMKCTLSSKRSARKSMGASLMAFQTALRSPSVSQSSHYLVMPIQPE